LKLLRTWHVRSKRRIDSNVDKLTQTLAELGVLLTDSRAQLATAERRNAQAHARERKTRREYNTAREKLNVLGIRARGMQEIIRTSMQDFIDTSF